MSKQTLSNLPPKGTYDWLPPEFAVRKYIFDTWRKVCRSFGYEEYLTPLVESADIYRAKSGADIGGSELTTFMDRGDRELAIRPEMTPSVTRMVSRIYEATPKPIRLFSIANFYRNERPQRGRNREFWQLNCDIFGVESSLADLEILQLALEIMLSFSPPKGSFTLYINNRKLIDAVLPQTKNRTDIVRLLDKAEKLSPTDLSAQLDLLDLSSNQKDLLINFINSSSATQLIKNIPSLKSNPGYLECVELLSKLEALGYSDWVQFKPNVIRGFDYYDGMVFEVFDNNPKNLRSMFGGGRYNGLAGIFGGSSFPATGFAPGDETTKLFLES
ncbi:MAG: ATP phosphoribosyltransferase regulatory subunit, partial [Patescibacteria group bacterium]